MLTLLDLWLPILVSAVFVFIISSVLHMVIPIHKGDWKKFPGEEEVLAAMRTQGVIPGDYMFPWANSMKEMSTPQMVEKQNLGPVGFLHVLSNGPLNMGKSLGQWLVYCIVMSLFVAYITKLAYAADTAYAEIFRCSGTVAILGYAMGNVQNSIWKGVCWLTTLKFVFDGTVYGLVTAGTFGWLWPEAS